MGSRSSATLKEIESIRGGLDAKLTELERRLPPMAKLGRRAVGAALGGGVSGTALWFVARRVRGRKAKTSEAPKADRPVSVVVNVFPKGAVPIAVAAAALWAGVRIYEARARARGEERPRAVVRSIGTAGEDTAASR